MNKEQLIDYIEKKWFEDQKLQEVMAEFWATKWYDYSIAKTLKGVIAKLEEDKVRKLVCEGFRVRYTGEEVFWVAENEGIFPYSQVEMKGVVVAMLDDCDEIDLKIVLRELKDKGFYSLS